MDCKSDISQIYKPLSHSNDEIRLLFVLPSATYSEPFRCEIKTFCLADAPRFMALSYEWGPEEDTSKNIITIGCHHMHIRSNLRNALLRFRAMLNEERDYLLWVDAICINQDDLVERGHQVGMMTRIYQQGYVMAWLGLEEEGVQLGFELLGQCDDFVVGRGRTREEIGDWIKQRLFDPEFETHWVSLTQIYQMSYWTRMWIIQELVCGRNALLACGALRAQFGNIAMLSQYLIDYMPQSRTSEGFRWPLAVRKLIDRSRMVGVLADHFWRWKEPEQNEDIDGLLYNLTMYRDRCCTDSRDRVYSLLGVTLQYSGVILDINYSISVDKVFTNTARHMARGSQKLETLLHCRTKFKPQYTLPSWVPDWTAFDAHQLTWGAGEYSASGSSPATAIFSEDSRILTTRAILLGTISRRSPFYGMPTPIEELAEDFQHWVHLAVSSNIAKYGVPIFQQTDIVRAFYETVFRPSGGISQFLTAVPFEHFLKYSLQVFGSIEFKPTPSAPVPGLVDPDALVAITKDLVKNFLLAGRCVFSTTVFNMGPGGDVVFGLCHPEAEVGDVVAIVLGCSEPVILHPRNDCYEVAGQAYVPGFMHGEAILKLADVEISLA